MVTHHRQASRFVGGGNPSDGWVENLGRFAMDYREYSACTDCLHLTANGETDPDSVEAIAGYQKWHEVNSEWHLVPGVTDHSERCTPKDREEGCDCESLGFSWHPCEVCGVNLGGDRFVLTAFRKDGK